MGQAQLAATVARAMGAEASAPDVAQARDAFDEWLARPVASQPTRSADRDQWELNRALGVGR